MKVSQLELFLGLGWRPSSSARQFVSYRGVESFQIEGLL